jgi:hypothetical protein
VIQHLRQRVQALMRRRIARAWRHPAREGEWQRVHLEPRMTQIQLVRKACGIGRTQHHLVADLYATHADSGGQYLTRRFVAQQVG